MPEKLKAVLSQSKEQTFRKKQSDMDKSSAIHPVQSSPAPKLKITLRKNIDLESLTANGTPSRVHENLRLGDKYHSWTNKSTGIRIVGPCGGTLSATHKRGAPKIGSRAKDYGNVKLGDKYVDYINGIKSDNKSDSEIAESLLELDAKELPKLTNVKKRAIDMLHTTVYISEEWRKQGASKLYRSYLKLVKEGKASLDFESFKKYFNFIASADAGRRQVGKIRDAINNPSRKENLSKENQQIYDALSPRQHGDFTSDEEMREKKKIKKKRVYEKLL